MPPDPFEARAQATIDLCDKDWSDATQHVARALRAARREALEEGWRTFWEAYAEFLDLGREQRTYGWHDLINAERKGMDAVRALIAEPEKDEGR